MRRSTLVPIQERAVEAGGLPVAPADQALAGDADAARFVSCYSRVTR